MNKPVQFMIHSEVREFINGDKSYVIIMSVDGKQHYCGLEYEFAMDNENVLQACRQMMEVVLAKKE
jgi:hypothetical protein